MALLEISPAGRWVGGRVVLRFVLPSLAWRMQGGRSCREYDPFFLGLEDLADKEEGLAILGFQVVVGLAGSKGPGSLISTCQDHHSGLAGGRDHVLYVFAVSGLYGYIYLNSDPPAKP